MKKLSLHIISFDNPFPPSYGGTIDVFYKIKALHSIGITIHLHCFVKEIPILNTEIKDLVDECYFYKSKKGITSFLSLLPFSVSSRYDKQLAINLKKMEAPILFESNKVLAVLQNQFFPNTYLRLHNIESDYFFGIAKSETNLFLKGSYYLEALKFKRFERKMENFNAIFTLSKKEEKWANQINKNTFYIPLFHGNKSIADLTPFGKYAIYSGDLCTSDNRKAVEFLIAIFKKIGDYELVIAVSDKLEYVRKEIGNAKNIRLVKTENYQHLQDLLAEAHINVMVSFQASGTKLKLVNALFNSRHCLINKNMVDDNSIQQLCEVANTQEEFIEKIQILRKQPYEAMQHRKVIISEVYDDYKNAKKIETLLLKDTKPLVEPLQK